MENLVSPICSTLPGRHACRLGSSGSTGCCCVSSSYSTTDTSSSGFAFECACPFFLFCFLSAASKHLITVRREVSRFHATAQIRVPPPTVQNRG